MKDKQAFIMLTQEEAETINGGFSIDVVLHPELFPLDPEVKLSAPSVAVPVDLSGGVDILGATASIGIH